MKLSELHLPKLLLEANLSRFLEHIQSGRDFTIISASRNSIETTDGKVALSPADNRRRSGKLRQQLDAVAAGPHSLLGRWGECQDPRYSYEDCPEHLKQEVSERSFFAIRPQGMDSQQFKQMVVGLVKQYSQDGALVGAGEKVKLLSVLGHASVTDSDASGLINCIIRSGREKRPGFKLNAVVRVSRNGNFVGEGYITSIRKDDEDLEEIQDGGCSVRIDGVDKVAPGDVLDCVKESDIGSRMAFIKNLGGYSTQRKPQVPISFTL